MPDNVDKIKKLAGFMLSHAEAEPPADMWSRIELQMKRKRRVLLYRVLSVAATVLILLGVGFSLLMRDNVRDYGNEGLSQSKQTESADLTPDNKLQSTPGSNVQSGAGVVERHTNTAPASPVMKKKNFVSLQNSKPTKTIAVAQLQVPNQEVPIIQPLPVVKNDLTDEAFPVVSIEATANMNDLIKPVETGNNPVIDLSALKPVEPAELSTASGRNTWSLAMGYGTSSSIADAQQDASLSSSGSNYSHDALSAEVANNTSYFEDIENTTHDAPLSLGFIISKSCGKRWFVETGLLYTRLGYRLKTREMNNTYLQYANRLNYLGIPLGIRFGFVEHRNFGIYATQSVILEKGISGQSSADTYWQGVLTDTENNREKVRGVQFSSLTGIGGDVKVAGHFSVYGQAGIQLFFLNSTQPYNIRSARVAWPSFQVGLRMTLK